MAARRLTRAWAGILVTALLIAGVSTALAQPPATLTGTRGEWIKFGRGYDNHHYSPLSQINRRTIAALAPRWVYQSGLTESFQAEPLVEGGVLYITLPANHVVALDAVTGRVLWRYQHAFRAGVSGGSPGGPANRGAALGYGKVFEATNDGRLLALDQATGKPVWDVVFAEPTAAELAALADRPDLQETLRRNLRRVNSKMPPLVYGGMVIIGTLSGAEGVSLQRGADGRLTGADAARLDGADFNRLIEARIGQRAFFAAFDAATGKELWRWHVTGPGWEGGFVETTADGVPVNRDTAAERAAAARLRNSWWAGGGTTWSTPALDPQTGLIFLGTGNPSPVGASFLRPGDNLHTTSLVALDVRTGKLAWSHQFVPHDDWGYDVNSQPVLFDLPGGRKAVGAAGKSGWFYGLDRKSGELIFKSDPLVPLRNTFARSTPEGVPFAPGSFGGAAWSPISYDPTSGVAYIAGVHRPALLRDRVIPAEGARPEIRLEQTIYADPRLGPSFGTLTAIDTRNRGKTKWQVRTERPLVGGVLATAGGLVFTGQADGRFTAFDKDDGKELWSFQTGAGVSAPPISYEIGGVQYVAVAAGGNEIFNAPPGDALFVFALPRR